jgi:glutamate-1-semialdehyde 2,1-aminomutase
VSHLIEDWPESAKAWERAKLSLAGGVSSGLRASMRPFPLSFDHGSGCRLWDLDGNEYLDYVLGWGPVILGHSHPALVDAVASQLTRGQTYGAGHRLEYEVAERVCDRVLGAERVLWTNTGSEANLVALRLARAATGRRRFVKFGGHYHGWTDTMLHGYRPGAGGSLAAPASAGQPPASRDDVVLLPWNDLDAVWQVFTERGDDIAAVFAEPVLCNSCVLPPAPGFLDGLRALCDRHGTVLVFDEVITGFRVARGGGAERYGVTPDLTVLAKAIAGGMPLASVAGRASLVEQTTRGVVHAGTYNGNPLVLAAAAAVLDVLDEPSVYDAFESRAAELEAGLRQALARHGVPGSVHHVGPVVQCIPGPGSPGATRFDAFLAADWEWYDALTVELLRRGVFALPGGRWYLSTMHDEEAVRATVDAFDSAVAAVPR